MLSRYFTNFTTPSPSDQCYVCGPPGWSPPWPKASWPPPHCPWPPSRRVAPGNIRCHVPLPRNFHGFFRVWTSSPIGFCEVLFIIEFILNDFAYVADCLFLLITNSTNRLEQIIVCVCVCVCAFMCFPNNPTRIPNIMYCSFLSLFSSSTSKFLSSHCNLRRNTYHPPKLLLEVIQVLVKPQNAPTKNTGLVPALWARGRSLWKLGRRRVRSGIKCS